MEERSKQKKYLKKKKVFEEIIAKNFPQICWEL